MCTVKSTTGTDHKATKMSFISTLEEHVRSICIRDQLSNVSCVQTAEWVKPPDFYWTPWHLPTETPFSPHWLTVRLMCRVYFSLPSWQSHPCRALLKLWLLLPGVLMRTIYQHLWRECTVKANLQSLPRFKFQIMVGAKGSDETLPMFSSEVE